MDRRYNNSNQRRKIRTHKTGRRNINEYMNYKMPVTGPEKTKQILFERNSVARPPHFQKQILNRTKKITLPITNLGHPRNPKRTEIISRCGPIILKIYQRSFETDRPNETIIKERYGTEMDRRKRKRFQER